MNAAVQGHAPSVIGTTAAAKKKAGKRKHDYDDLCRKATVLIRQRQAVSYKLLENELDIAPSTAQTLLKRMSRKGFVVQKKDRKWLVLVNPDGTKRTAEGVVPPRRLKKAKRKKTKEASAGVATPIVSIAATTEVTSQEKLALLSELISMSSGRSAKVLNAIAEDVKSAAKADKLAGVLNRK